MAPKIGRRFRNGKVARRREGEGAWAIKEGHEVLGENHKLPLDGSAQMG